MNTIENVGDAPRTQTARTAEGKHIPRNNLVPSATSFAIKNRTGQPIREARYKFYYLLNIEDRSTYRKECNNKKNKDSISAAV